MSYGIDIVESLRLVGVYTGPASQGREAGRPSCRAHSYLGGGPFLTSISITEKVDWPDHNRAIFLKSSCVAF
jgi:hypothetical protein